MHKIIQASVLFLAAVLAAGCIGPVQQTTTIGSVTGNVIYNGQIDLTDVALVTVQLRDVTAGVPNSELVNQQQIDTNGNPPPYAFEVPFTPLAVDQSHSYALVAFIQDAAGHIIFRSDEPAPALTQGNSMAGSTFRSCPWIATLASIRRGTGGGQRTHRRIVGSRQPGRQPTGGRHHVDRAVWRRWHTQRL